MKVKFRLALKDEEYPENVSIKSACFHNKRSFLYLGLSSGTILCHDYSLSSVSSGDHSLVSELQCHHGPVRCLQHHPRHSLLASGGDDSTVLVWSSAGHRRLFTLRGHQDYVRCVQWHAQYPWLVSAGDDCSIIIWNWQNRSQVTSITGCQHWVTDIALHPTRDLLVSASLDMSVRVWDYSSLRNRTCNIGKHSEVFTLFGALDVVCDKVLDSFNEKLMFVMVHPTKEILVIGHGSQVTLVSLESYQDVGRLYADKTEMCGAVWQVDTSLGTYDTLVTMDRDKVKSWKYSVGVCKVSVDTDHRYHGLTGSTRHQHLCSWSRRQLTVFKIVSERPVFISHLHHLYYIKQGTIRHYNAHKEKETVLFKLTVPERGACYTSLQYNPTEHSLLLNSSSKHRVNRDLYQLFVIIDGVVNGKPKTAVSQGKTAVWSAHNRFVHLDDLNNIIVKNLDNKNINFGGFSAGFLLPKSEKNANSVYKPPTCEQLFEGSIPGSVLIRDGDCFTMYDINKKRRLCSSKFSDIKRVVWSQDKTMVALCSKYKIFICDNSLKVITSHESRVPVKSCVWQHDTGALLFSTHTTVRYLIPCSGDHGSVVTTSETLYLGLVSGSSLVCLNRRHQIKIMEVNLSEVMFKTAVLREDRDEYMRLILSGQMIGQSQLQFLREVGKPELALGFIKDPTSRFSLALEANDLDSALEAAHLLDNVDAWSRLAELSLINGNVRVAELCYQKCRRYDKLLFLYTLTGEREKLVKLSRILRVRREMSQVVMVMMILGDTPGLRDTLAAGGEDSLADLVMKKDSCLPESVMTHVKPSSDNWPRAEPLKMRDVKTKMKMRDQLQEQYREQLQQSFKI